jgi:hypothetical protein
MSETSSERGASLALVTALLLLLAIASAVALAQLVEPAVSPGAGEAIAHLRAGDAAGAIDLAAGSGALAWLAIPVLGPLLVALVAALARRRGPREGVVESGAPGAPATAAAPPAPPSPAVGLRLLAALQEDARLLDFVREDIAGYSDEQVGSAVRGIHAALRKAIDARVAIEPILAGEDGDPVEVPAGFDPASVRVTGSPSGPPPYRGVLRHGGWRARDARLPLPTEGSDPAILMPAEVEVG